MYIYALNKSVDEFNMQRLSTLTSDTFVIDAVDVNSKSYTMQLVKRLYTKKDSVLPASLHLAVSARVMLIINLDVEDGLVNGAVGTITYISSTKNDFQQPKYVAVKFDNGNIGKKAISKINIVLPLIAKNRVLIEPYKELISVNSCEYTRYQFPLKLSWACTIHKMQGMTVNNAVISLNGVFKEGMAYVALSRVTNIQGIIFA